MAAMDTVQSNGNYDANWLGLHVKDTWYCNVGEYRRACSVITGENANGITYTEFIEGDVSGYTTTYERYDIVYDALSDVYRPELTVTTTMPFSYDAQNNVSYNTGNLLYKYSGAPANYTGSAILPYELGTQPAVRAREYFDTPTSGTGTATVEIDIGGERLTFESQMLGNTITRFIDDDAQIDMEE